MAVDSFSHSSSEALNDLDPLSRALLDLSVQRGMDDGEIAGVLGTDAESVFEVRVGLLRTLAEKVAPEHVDDDIPELQAVIAERLYAENGATGTAENGAQAAIPVDEVPEIDEAEPTAERPALHAVPDWASESAPPKPSTPAPSKRRSPLTFLVPILAIAALVAVVVTITSSGGDEQSSPEPSAQQPAAGGAGDQPADAKPATAPLEAIGDGDARGTASIDGDRLTLKLRGLADPSGGSYEVWLYDSIIDAKSLGASQDTKIDLDAKLPANARDFEYVDVSLEPADGNRNHSGQSVLRVPLSELR